MNGADLEPEFIEQIAEAAFAQPRREKRIAGLGRALVALCLLFLLLPLTISLVAGSGPSLVRLRDHTALIEVRGNLAEDAPANALRIVAGLQDAFETRRAKAVILRIDSVGGSLV